MPFVNSVVRLSVTLSWNEMWNTGLALKYLKLDLAADVRVLWLVHYFDLEEGHP